MKPTLPFLVTLGSLLALAAVLFFTLQSETAKHDAAAFQAAKGLDGYHTPQEDADKRADDYMRKLGMSEERITQERLIRSNERLAKALDSAK